MTPTYPKARTKSQRDLPRLQGASAAQRPKLGDTDFLPHGLQSRESMKKRGIIFSSLKDKRNWLFSGLNSEVCFIL
jgi:hypothetical protein